MDSELQNLIMYCKKKYFIHLVLNLNVPSLSWQSQD